MDNPQTGLYNDVPAVGSDHNDWQQYQAQQGRAIAPYQGQQSAPQPMYTTGARVQIIDGVHIGLVGVVHRVGVTADGVFSYTVADLPHPANPNRTYNYRESQLSVPEQVPAPTNGNTPPIPQTTGMMQAVTDASMQTRALERMAEQILELSLRFDRLEQAIITELGRINVHVTYQPATIDARHRAPATPRDAEQSALGTTDTPSQIELRLNGEREPEAEGEPLGERDRTPDPSSESTEDADNVR